MREALGWTLAHSLWEGAAIALLLAAGLSGTRSARVRYGAACAAMVAMLAAFGATFWYLAGTVSHAAGVGVVRGLMRLPGAATGDFGAGGVDPVSWAVPFWIAGVAIFQLRGAWNWLLVNRLKKRGVCAATAEWQERLDGLRSAMRVSRPVALLESCMADVPVVIGYLRPAILAPVGLLAGMPAAQVETILLHELAHIRRFDYLVNLLQTSIEGLLFYHPATWWISHVIRTEREHCCDDMVVAFHGDAHQYAVALTALEEVRYTASHAAMAATGGDLMKRIRRLLRQPEGPRAGLAPVVSTAIITITTVLALTAWQTGHAAPSPRPHPPQQKQGGTAAPGDPFTKWLNADVAYIIDDRERAAFKSLTTNEEKEHFIEQFWERRDPTPGTAENEYKIEHYRRIGYANGRFSDSKVPGWKTDRGRVYIIYGPPDEIESYPKSDASHAFPYEQWLYHYVQGIGDNVILEFDDKESNGEYRMAMDPRK